MSAAERRVPPPIGFAVVLAAVIVIGAFIARFAIEIPGQPMTPDSLLGLLLAAAFACGAALMVRRRETVAWLLAVGAAGFAAFRFLALLRALETALGALAPAIPTVWPWLLPGTYAALLLAVIVATAYAARKRESARPWVHLGIPVAAVIGVIGVAAALVLSLLAPTDLDQSRVAGRIALGVALIAALVGAARDLAGPMARAQQRLLEQPLGKRGSTITVYGRLLRDELFPSATEQRRIAVEEERARLAADLHALVLPDLRRAAAAAAAAAAGRPDDPVASGLQSALADIEQLIHGRQSVVLEQFGLGAALEWLAERVEERSDVRVSIDEPDTSWIGVGNRTLDEHMPAARQRAAFRVALLALDNVVRHANARTATIEFGVAPRQFLAITDDGDGMHEGSAAAARPGRGLVDMRAEAVSTGATLEITSSPTGTRIEIAWGRRDADAGHPATAATEAAAGTRPGHRRA
jgi:signal transduction histidine kinase